MRKLLLILFPTVLISCSQGQIQQTQALLCNVTLDESLASCAK